MQQNRIVTQRDITKIVGVAALIDLIEVPLQFIPVLGWILIVIIDGLTYLTFYFWFKRLGVNLRTTKRFIAFNSGLILDLIPFINTFAWTLDVSMVLWSVYNEQKASKLS